MRLMLLLSLVIAITNGQWQGSQQQTQRVFPMPQNNFQTSIASGLRLQSDIRIPFPQCLTTDRAASILNSETILNIFQIKLQEEDRKLKQERSRNDILNNSMYYIIYRFKITKNKLFFFI